MGNNEGVAGSKEKHKSGKICYIVPRTKAN